MAKRKKTSRRERLLQESDAYLEGFEAWLRAGKLSEGTIRRHTENVEFFLKTYLPTTDAENVAEGCLYAVDYLGYFLIEKCTWITPTSLKQNITSYKKFYRFMLEQGRLDPAWYETLESFIKDMQPGWIEECRRLASTYPPTDALPNLQDAAPPDKGLLEALYEAVTKRFDLDDLIYPDDADESDSYSADPDYPPLTRQEVINELTLALLYLTSREEEAFKNSGIYVRRAPTAADAPALDWLTDNGFITGGSKAQQVSLTDDGVYQAEMTLMGLGLEHLTEHSFEGDIPFGNTGSDSKPATGTSTGTTPSGWKIIK